MSLLHARKSKKAPHIAQPEEGASIEAQMEEMLHPAAGVKKRRFWKKKRFWAVLVLLCLVLGGISMLGGKKAALPVQTATLQRQDLSAYVRVSGPVSGTDTAEVYSNLHAQVKEILVKEGQAVRKGETLAVLDDREVKRALEQAQNQLALAQANEENSGRQRKAEYQRAKSALDAAGQDLNAKQALYQSGDLARTEYEQAQRAYADAKAAMAAFALKDGKLQADEAAHLQTVNAQLELEKAEEAYGQIHVTAPIDGTVTRVNTQLGQFADLRQDNKAMFALENLEQLQLKVNISEYSIARVKLNQKALISADILDGRKLNGHVSSISPSGERKDGGSSERVIPAVISLDPGQEGLISGITANAELLSGEAKQVYAVPLSALMTAPDGSTQLVFVVDGQLRLCPIKTGLESDTMVEVKPVDESNPLFADGAVYVLNPEPTMTEGMAVMAQPTAADQSEASGEPAQSEAAGEAAQNEADRADDAASSEAAPKAVGGDKSAGGEQSESEAVSQEVSENMQSTQADSAAAQ